MEKVGGAAVGQVLQTVVSKELVGGGRRWLEVVNMVCATLSVIFLSFTNSNQPVSNIIILYIIKAYRQLQSHPTLPDVLVCFFFSTTLKTLLLPVVLFVTRLIQEEHSEGWERVRKGVRRYLAYWLIAYEALLVPLVVLCFKLGSGNSLILSRITFIVVVPIVYTFRLKLLYGLFFFVIILMAWIIPAQYFAICLLLFSIFQLLKGESHMQTYHLLIAVYQLIITFNSITRTDISPFHLIIITVTVLGISLLRPTHTLHENGAETILEAIEKLHRGDTLSQEKKWELCILGCYIAQQTIKQSIPWDGSKESIQSLQITETKEGLCSLLKSWLLLKKTSNPLDLLIDIQMAEGQLFRRNFGVSTLPQIEAVSNTIEEKGCFSNRLRMMKLRHRLEDELMRKDQKLCKLWSVVQVEKYKETLRERTEGLSRLYVAFWQLQGRTEDKIMKKLDEICSTQQECLSLLKTLQKHGQMHNQVRIFNLLERSFNNFARGVVEEQRSREVKEESRDTSYIMVSGSIITDISQSLANQIHLEKDFIVGCDVLNIIPVELHSYYRTHLSQWLVSSHPVYLPLASAHDETVFFPSQSLFKILPQIEGGVRYLINVWTNSICQEDAYLLYSIGNDRITKATHDFRREWLKGSGSFSPQQVLGIDLTFLSNYIGPESSTQPIVCELTFKALEKKSRARRVSRQTQHLLRLVELYQTREDQFCLLSISDKGDNRIKRPTDATLVQLQLMQKEQMIHHSDPTFCPIKNPHQELLDQRLNQHQSDVFHRTYLRTIIIILLIGLLVGIGAFIQFQVVTNTSIGTLSQQVATYSDHLYNKEKIYVLFYQFYIYIHSIKQPNDFILTKTPLSITKLQAQFKSKVTKNLATVVTITLDPQTRLTHTPYQLIYPDYVTNEATESSTLVPLLEAIRTSLTTQDFTFVIRNANVVDAYIDSLLPIDTNILHEAQQLESIYLITATAILVACLLLAKCQYLWIRITIWNALQLYGKLSKEQISKHVAFIVKIKQAEKTLNEQEIDSLNQSRSKNCQMVEPVKTATLLKALMSENVLLIVMALVWACFYYYCYHRLDAYMAEINLITNYSQRIQYISQIMTSTSEFYYRVAMQELLPQEQRYQSSSPTILNLPSLFPSFEDLPLAFADFANTQGNLLQQNICTMTNVQAAIQKDLFLATLDCNSILKNVLTDGFDTAFSYYLHMLEKSYGTLLTDLGKTYEEKSFYPLFAEVIYCRRVFDSVISAVQTAFSAQISEFMRAKDDEFGVLIGLGVVVGVVVVLLGGMFVWRMRRVCRAGKKVFGVVPKSLIYNIRVSKQLLNSSLLSDIERLSP